MDSGLQVHFLTSNQEYYDRGLAESLATGVARCHFADYTAQYVRNRSSVIFSVFDSGYPWEKSPVTIEVFDHPRSYKEFIPLPTQKDPTAGAIQLVHPIQGDKDDLLHGPYLWDKNIKEVFQLFAIAGTKVPISITDVNDDMQKLYNAASALSYEFKRRSNEMIPRGSFNLVYFDNGKFYTPGRIFRILEGKRDKDEEERRRIRHQKPDHLKTIEELCADIDEKCRGPRKGQD